MVPNEMSSNREQVKQVANGWIMLVIWVLLLLADIGLLIRVITLLNAQTEGGAQPAGLVAAAVLLVAPGLPFIIVMLSGLFTLQPNEARVLLLFGAYKGTVKEPGLHWANPFYSNGAGKFNVKTAPADAFKFGRNKISLRRRTYNGSALKVNDKRGNPIEIAAVVVWRVADTAQAMFDVDNYQTYMQTQSESALRHLASLYSYDDGEENESTLRGNVEEISRALCSELQDRLAKAGLVVDEARLTHLAYAPEIAQAMLRRQQAEAVIAARQKIVHGAVSMVDMALKDLADKHVVALDDERKAAMVSNLMVVLCGESEVHPVVNTGTLYN